MIALNRVKRVVPLVSILTVLLLIVTCVWLDSRITEQRRQQVGQALSGLQHSTHQAVRKWISEEQTRARAWSEAPDIIELTSQLMDQPRTPEALIPHPAQQRMRELLGNVVRASDFDGFFVIARDYTSLASSRDSNTGTRNLLAVQPDVLDKVWRGQLAVSRPLVSDVELEGKQGDPLARRVTMFVLAPIGERDGTVQAALAFRISLSRELVPIIANSYLGDSGYSYAFNRQGQVLSEVRLHAPDRSAERLMNQIVVDGYVVVRDPGADLLAGEPADRLRAEQPLTRLAEEAIRGTSGGRVEPYRDYRGVPVVGAWTWDDELGMAIATEVEASEAYVGLSSTRWALGMLTLVAVILGVTASVITTIQHRKIIQSEMSHRGLIENLPAVTCVMDLSEPGGFDYVSDQIESLCGYKPLDFLPQGRTNFEELIRPDDRQRVREARGDAAGSGEMYSIEYRLVTRDGSQRWVHEQGRCVRAAAGVKEVIDAVLTDVTEREESQMLLHQYQQALDSASIVAITDRAGTIIHVNDNFCEISKYPRAELVGANHRILNSGHHPKSFFVEMYRCLAQNGVWRGEICNRAKDGQIYWVDTTIIAFYDADGRIDKYLAIRNDITNRKLTENKLREVNAELEARAHEMEQFTYSVSHDLKSPLVSCVGLLNCLEADYKAQETEQVADSIHRMRRSIGRMGECIDDLLELSRIGRIRHEPRELDMNELVRGVVDDLRVQADQQGATIEVAPDLPGVFADPVRIGEVIENLVSNALKYGCGGENKRVEVGWTGVSHKPHFYVRDYGAGIPQRYQSKVFGLFQRLDKTKGGTGVGLTIVKRIVEIHGGRIWVESSEGMGTTFWFTLPVGAAQAEDAAGVSPLVDLQSAAEREIA